MISANSLQLLRIPEAAALLGCSTSSIYRWISQGRIPVVSIGVACTRIRAEDLAAYVERCATTHNVEESTDA